MNSINGGLFVLISGVYKYHPAPRLETKCQTGAPSIQFHARMLNLRLSSEVAQTQSLESYGIFRTLAGLGSGPLSVTAMLDFSGKANTSIRGLGEDDTATQSPVQLQALRSHHTNSFAHIIIKFRIRMLVSF